MNENKVTVALHMDFFGAYTRLPRTVQNKVMTFVNKFRVNPKASGIHYEKIAGALDQKMYSVRIDDTYRGIVVVQEETGTYLLLWVDHHDEAYRWAIRKKCDINPHTGVLQLYEVQYVGSPGESDSSAATPAVGKPANSAAGSTDWASKAAGSTDGASRAAGSTDGVSRAAGSTDWASRAAGSTEGASRAEEPAPPRMFANIASRDLLALGVPEAQMDFVRSLPHSAALFEAKPKLAARAFEALSWLAEDFPVNEVLDLMNSQTEAVSEPGFTSFAEVGASLQTMLVGDQSAPSDSMAPSDSVALSGGLAPSDSVALSGGLASSDSVALSGGLAPSDSVALSGGLASSDSVAPSDNLALALANPGSLASFVVVEGEEELRRILDAPLEKWRVFLHPEQRQIVKRTFRGSARVLGGAGTGKTVVAMHRAKHLAAKCSSQERVLFTTFTVNLAADIRDNLSKICTDEELEKIEVINLDAWVNKCLRRLGYNAEISYGEKLNELWKEAIIEADDALDLPVSFYEEEWNRVVIAQDAFTEKEYLRASRVGRGTRLDRKKRRAVWQVLDGYQRLMKERGLRDINTAMCECRTLLGMELRPQYKHIIVDEGQDFSPSAYLLLRELAGQEHEDDIFIVGDAHQRIYKNRASLYNCGINVRGRGRSHTLKINYRTTEEIRRCALALLKGLSFDDLDEAEDKNVCQSLTHGAPPVVREFRHAEEELDYLAGEIGRLQAEGVPLNNICVVGRTNAIIEGYYSKLTARGLLCYKLKRNSQDERSHEGVRLATMHRVKGLEFRYVFVASVNHGLVPLASAIDCCDDVAKREALTAEKCLLYVALTRAQQGAYITSYGCSSEFLAGWGEPS